MQDFNVLTLGEDLSNEELELAIAAFAELYQKLTFKHHRKIRIKVVCTLDRAEWVLTLARNHQIGSNLEMIPNNDFDRDNWASLEASLLFLPTQKRAGKITRESLAQGIPVIAYQNESIAEYIDESCGMLVRSRSRSQDLDAFSRILSMLYYDPEVRKLLKKGARKKYHEINGFRERTRDWTFN